MSNQQSVGCATPALRTGANHVGERRARVQCTPDTPHPNRRLVFEESPGGVGDNSVPLIEALCGPEDPEIDTECASVLMKVIVLDVWSFTCLCACPVRSRAPLRLLYFYFIFHFHFKFRLLFFALYLDVPLIVILSMIS